jgi:putative transposase
MERAQALSLIAEACVSGATKRKACELLGIAMRTIERWEKNGLIDKRKQAERKPANKLSEKERETVLTIANSKPYQNLSPCKIVPMLADEGRYVASESTFYRVLRAENQLTHRQLSRPTKHRRPTSYQATGPNQVWTWDISYLPTQVRGIYFYLYMIVDIFSRKIVGWSIHEVESSEHAARLIKQACLDEKINRKQIVLHSDNGSSMKGATMLAMLQTLGVMPSFSRPSVSDDNPYSESLFKTLKYHPTFPKWKKFACINESRIWCESFVVWYNEAHLHSALKFVTPQQRHTGVDVVVLKGRHLVYQMAKRQNPERWSGNSRDWLLAKVVTLNPDKKSAHHKLENCGRLKLVN